MNVPGTHTASVPPRACRLQTPMLHPPKEVRRAAHHPPEIYASKIEWIKSFQMRHMATATSNERTNQNISCPEREPNAGAQITDESRG